MRPPGGDGTREPDNRYEEYNRDHYRNLRHHQAGNPKDVPAEANLKHLLEALPVTSEPEASAALTPAGIAPIPPSNLPWIRILPHPIREVVQRTDENRPFLLCNTLQPRPPGLHWPNPERATSWKSQNAERSLSNPGAFLQRPNRAPPIDHW
jgi:hypothetical protein